MELLLLGGYRFLGRAIVEVAQARGHAVTAFNRGNLTPPPGVGTIRGDRDDRTTEKPIPAEQQKLHDRQFSRMKEVPLRSKP